MAKTLEDRPVTGEPLTTAPTPEPVAEPPRAPPAVRLDGKRIRYNPEPGFRVLVCDANEYGEVLPRPKMHVFGFPKQRRRPDGQVELEFDQAEYLLRLPKPGNLKPSQWWREATTEEMAAYQEETGAFGGGPFAEELRRDWKARHPDYREGPPPAPTTASEQALIKLAQHLDNLEGGKR